VLPAGGGIAEPVKPLVLFGAGDLARLAYLAFAQEGRDVVACTVSQELVDRTELFGLPVVAWEELESSCPPDDHELFVAVGYSAVNRHRASLCEDAVVRGYGLASHVSPSAIVASDVEIRQNTFLFEGVVVQPFVTLGRNVIIWSGAVVSHDSRVGDNCFIAPRAAIAGNVRLGDNCFVGVNATIRDGVTVADDCVIGAGAVVKHDTNPGEVFSAVPTTASKRPSSELERL
jgi:sugar O-acyltransferase (sialic acid O-acetyltransferase NeuD family)